MRSSSPCGIRHIAALRERRYGALVALVVLGLVLAYVAWIAAQVFALQEADGISTQAALARLGMDPALWLVQRTALSVFLVCLAGWTRYHAPAPDVAADAQVERSRLEAALSLEPLRAELRARQARGLRGTLVAAIGREGARYYRARRGHASAFSARSSAIAAADWRWYALYCFEAQRRRPQGR